VTVNRVLFILAGVVFLLAFLIAGDAISASGNWWAPQTLGFGGLTLVAFGLAV
jgi:hypothetical protein